LWSFIDEIVGKGLDTIDLFELIFYRSLSLFPLALPIGVLIASVMVYGDLSEKYELSSLKSAGISLPRVMFSTIFISIVIGFFSFYCSNTLIPLANLKFQSRLYDIRNQKPALSLEEKIFNDDFRGFSIRINKKGKDNRYIEDVLVYDHSAGNRRMFKLVSAESGEMYVDKEEDAFVLKLYNGYQYQELEKQSKNRYPFTRTSFREWVKHFDLGEFDLNRTDEDLFKSHHTMKSVKQLLHELDTIDRRVEFTINRNLKDFNHILEHTDGIDNRLDKNPHEIDLDTVGDTGKKEFIKQIQVQMGNRKVSSAVPASERMSVIWQVMDTINPANLTSFREAFPVSEQRLYVTRAITKGKSFMEGSKRLDRSLKMFRENRIKHVYELHTKFSLAFVCMLFLFIGAPMGAIVRKGGYGYPLLISIIFFTIFIILNMMCKKLIETETLSPIMAAWIPNIVLLPFGIVLTYKAMNDSKMLNIDYYLKPIIKFFSKDAVA
jgi:lipopolysaccharide export system permease protein